MRSLLNHTVLTLLACLGLPLIGQATDTGSVLAGGNTADGSSVLFSLTSGVGNSGFGFQSLFHDTSGSFNTATGYRSLFNNTKGLSNTADGFEALFTDTTGIRNTAQGAGALFHNNGSFSSATGWAALFNNTIGVSNTADGYQALFSNTTADRNTAVGNGALFHSNASDSTAVGWAALFNNTSTGGNTAVGTQAAFFNTTGTEICAFGFHALLGSSGSHNSAFGYKGLLTNTTGDGNTAVGAEALELNNGGNDNTAVGFNALINSGSGSGNIGIGASAGDAVTSASNVIAIGDPGKNVSGTCFIDGIRGVTTQMANAVPVLIDSDNQLGTTSSSRRYKDNIEPMDKASEAVLALRPVTFNYKSDKTNTPQFGLIAEEVAEVNPDLIVRDKNGEIYSVRYDAVNAMLLNEFLKEHRKVQEQEATIAELKNDVGALVARIKEQDRKIQKVSDQVELNKSAARGVATSR